MAQDDGSTTSPSIWPLPKFTFEVDLTGQAIRFQEVTGLTREEQPIEFRHGDNPQFSTIKMPGLRKYAEVVMKKGTFSNDAGFWDWYNRIKLDTVKRADVTVRLLDEAGKPAMAWTLANAWPTRITAADLKSDGNEVAVETLVIAHEGISTSAA